LSTLKILIADDSADDRFLLQRSLRSVPRCEVVGCAEDGNATVQYLSGEGNFSDRTRFPFPDLLLLDLKMPGMNGFEVLEWLGQRVFRDLRVVVLSGSALEEDINKARRLGANEYLVKGESRGTAAALQAFLERSFGKKSLNHKKATESKPRPAKSIRPRS